LREVVGVNWGIGVKAMLRTLSKLDGLGTMEVDDE
jgi:hypothetical protein